MKLNGKFSLTLSYTRARRLSAIKSHLFDKHKFLNTEAEIQLRNVCVRAQHRKFILWRVAKIMKQQRKRKNKIVFKANGKNGH